MRTGVLALVVALGALGCTDTAQRLDPLPVFDRDVYAAGVQAYVGPGCATLDCHGDPGRPLRLYAEKGLRTSGDLRGMPITAAELEADVRAFEGVDPDVVDLAEHLAILKPLAVSAGGMHHVGDDVWPDTDDPGYLCLLGWLLGDDPTTSCADAAAALEP